MNLKENKSLQQVLKELKEGKKRDKLLPTLKLYKNVNGELGKVDNLIEATMAIYIENNKEEILWNYGN